MRSIRWSTSSFVLVALASAGCLDRPIEPIEPRRTSVVSERIPPAPTRIDLLLAIDNSGSMADKQRILSDAVPRLVERLVNPRCATADGQVIAPPESPTEKCPPGSKREFTPIEDVNVGVISSSLGDLGIGSPTCADEKAHLSGRATRADGTDYTIAPYANQSFLAWDPRNKRGGESGLPALRTSVADLVRGMGQDGCGYEMQLESVVRFLVDPAPYASVERVSSPPSYDTFRPRDVDQDLLVQRRDFLRPDSLVAILMLSDENDCSMMPRGVGPNVLRTTQTFIRSRAICATQPGDPCCASCGAQPPECPEDPTCASPVLSESEDKAGLRCWDQKRRYGIDFLYPIARYVNAFTKPRIDPTAPDLVPTSPDKAVDNPLFANLTGEDVSRRTSGFVFFAGIVGVPWQAITRKNEQGVPDLTLGYMTPAELETAGLFDALAGDPARFVPPTDPFMIESDVPRDGQSAILNASPRDDNAINGFDRVTDARLGDLEYACVFDLPPPHESGTADCAASPDSPLCDGETQIRAKAYPGLRQLSVIRGLGAQGVAGSVCPASLDDPTSETYGYNPAVGAIVEALRGRLDQQCLPRALHPDANQQVSCLVVEARHTEDTCKCDGVARRPIEGHGNVVETIQNDPTSDERWNCFCEVVQVTDAAGQQLCQNADDITLEQEDVHGFCYIDATSTPKIGNEALVARCPEGEKHAIRFVNEGRTPRGASAIVVCSDQSSD